MTILKIISKMYQKYRVFYYYRLSENKTGINIQIFKQPVLIEGKGVVSIHKSSRIGVDYSPGFMESYGYIEARNSISQIIIGENVQINNNIAIISEGEGIEIGDYTLIGHNVEIIDSDFHNLETGKRLTGKPKTGKVKIGKNVFIGNNVKITKGVINGDNSIIGIGSVVTSSFPGNCIIGGNPARLIRSL